MRRGVYLIAPLLLLALAGCGQYVIEGTVTNGAGQALPGVAVRNEANEAEALSDGLGEYRISGKGPEATLVYAKTGYAGARQTVARDTGIRVPAAPVTLWKLPPRSGVFGLLNGEYLEIGRALPRRFLLQGGGAVQGTRRAPETVLETLRPRLIFHQTPRYDAALSRLMETEVALIGEGTEEPVWTAAGTIKPDLLEIEGSDGQLRELRLDNDLEPGMYAVHWGALEGKSAVETQIYLFELREPPPPEPDPDIGAEQGEGEEALEEDADVESAETQPETMPKDEQAETPKPPAAIEPLEPSDEPARKTPQGDLEGLEPLELSSTTAAESPDADR